MLRHASVVLGLAVLLSLLFPMQALLKDGGVDAQAWRLPLLDVAAALAIASVAPAFLLFRDARLAQRIPRWSVWLVLLALSSLAFLLLHVSWSLELALAAAGQLLAGRTVSMSPAALVEALELAARLGVLVSLVGVLTRLESAPEDGVPPRRSETPAKRRKK